MMASMAKSLRRLVGKDVIVKLWRKSLDPDALEGYIVGLSPDFVLMHVMDDDIFLNGYAIVRVQDITQVEDKLKFADFYKQALKLRGYAPKPPRGIRLNSTAAILESVNQHYPLVTVHRERFFRNECSIGRIENLTEKTVVLQWLTPAARWDGYSPRYRLSSITKIDFDGLYEDALARVAGIQPEELNQPAISDGPGSYPRFHADLNPPGSHAGQ